MSKMPPFHYFTNFTSLEVLFGIRLSSLTLIIAVVPQMLHLSSSNLFYYFITRCFLGFPVDKNHTNLSLEALHATVCDLSVCAVIRAWFKEQYLCFFHNGLRKEPGNVTEVPLWINSLLNSMGLLIWRAVIAYHKLIFWLGNGTSKFSLWLILLQ
jgi:hypothetical protein